MIHPQRGPYGCLGEPEDLPKLRALVTETKLSTLAASLTSCLLGLGRTVPQDYACRGWKN